MKKILALIATLPVLLLALSLAVWTLPASNDDLVRIEIKAGDTLTGKARQWEADGWLPSALLLRIQARVLNKQHLRAGEYDVPPQLTGPELLTWLETAEAVTYRVRLIEGTRLVDALANIASANKLKQDIQPLTPEQVGQYLGIDGNPEGWLYPDTYVYSSGALASSVITQAYQRMQNQLQEAWSQRDKDLPYSTPYQALVMASIVEKETAVASERPQIAGVFVRRLRKGMRLETDPTVIYGLGTDFSGNLRKRHLLDRSNVYNTYRNHGLPPSPIALAGRQALDAALHPDEGDALFFVARGDGSHVFSATFAQHNKAVYQYQIRNRKADYRSTPEPAAPSSPASPDAGTQP
ncbi:endolytic transglycosylase MltG [Oceanobacter sp. 5_MG-2023]|uniref:endolytic transglycosylase MltG n=1 Tax=Oceanobacter sp. 5_MG-2023 TaxID=3062645 RepID=UPI0026E353C2|nr:endolytic transglycosylase MltG [Oceanobacter sp. 5_MG-2023]MDO6681047.1 endolytic transglycosylase MltG [Oceanobacter sp. 5_MG-2023]